MITAGSETDRDVITHRFTSLRDRISIFFCGKALTPGKCAARMKIIVLF